mmetsp:Transcript_40903/g.36095  ORF Transcript_40903/g.36095 Transcript_40903/m.36095 type:complete len:212 (+) Transcript_40903:41-676(+)
MDTSQRMNDEELSRFFKAWKTCQQMLSDRGYNVTEEDLMSSFDSFKEDYKHNPNRRNFKIYATKRDDDSNAIIVFFPDDDKLGVPTIKEVCNTMKDNDVTKGIIVCKNDITAFARRALEKVRGSCHIETFKQSELMINITKHKLVPRHEILTMFEKNKLMARYKLNAESQLPRIQKLDPVARYFGAEKGQIFKITRQSETAGRYVTYRIVK